MDPAVVKDIFGSAIDLPLEERGAFLDKACGEEPGLREELESLFAAHDASDGFLDRFADAVDGHGLLREALLEERYGNYTTEHVLATGGMGVVLACRDQAGNPVAIKVQPAYAAGDPKAQERFRREAKVTSRLQHPNLCSILEVGTTDSGALFIVMPLYEGETLADRLSAGAMPSPQALEIYRQCTDGLLAAHQTGIVHRDVKPANIFLTPDGPIVLDFGVARLLDASRLTVTGTRIGTAAYMSPEQARGQRADHRTDIWSMGVVFYEMLTGRRPFEGERPDQVVNAIVSQAPDPLPSDLPDAVARTVEASLAKDPEHRPGGFEIIHEWLAG